MNNTAIKTFKDLYEYVQEAERDDTGMHNINESLTFHIYEGRREMNIGLDKDEYGFPVLVNKIIFHEDENIASIYEINKGRTNYDSHVDVDFNEELNKCSWYLWVQRLYYPSK